MLRFRFPCDQVWYHTEVLQRRAGKQETTCWGLVKFSGKLPTGLSQGPARKLLAWLLMRLTAKLPTCANDIEGEEKHQNQKISAFPGNVPPAPPADQTNFVPAGKGQVFLSSGRGPTAEQRWVG